MVSSKSTEDYYYLKDSGRWDVSSTNKEYIKQFIIVKRSRGVSPIAINSYVGRVIAWMKEIGADDFKTVTTEQILAAYFDRMDRTATGKYSESSLDGDVVALKQFCQYLHGTKPGRELVSIKRKKTHNTYLSSEYVTPAQIKKMRNYAESAGDVRGTALLMVTFGTGARISEILDAKVKDLKIKQYNAVLSVDGKTGQRNIPFVIGMPEMIAWLNAHPVKLPNGKPDPESPLFVTYNTRGHGSRKLSRKRVESFFAEVAKKAGVPDDIKSSPHAFRHVMATTMARKLTLKEMNLLFGWSPQSTTALTYIHTSQDELESNILEINGISNPAENSVDEEFVIQCPSCNKILSAGTQVCSRCRMILDPVLAVQLNGMVSDMSKRDILTACIQDSHDMS